MINVIVTYTIGKDFVNTNLENINRFLEDFKLLDQSKFSYRVLVKEDGQTFVHISRYADAEIQKELLHVPSFLSFQKQRDESTDDIRQTIDVVELVGYSGEL